MKPTVSETLNGYDFTWPTLGITVHCRRLHSHSDGRLTGRLSVMATEEGKPLMVYPPSDFNFGADRSRDSLAKSLQAILPEVEWKNAINEICFAVHDRFYKGEPVKELWTHEDIPELEWLLEPLLIKGVPTVIFGEKGVGKSTLALAVYLALLLPWTDNPLGWQVGNKVVKTLYLDYELPGIIAQRNLKHLAEGMGIGAVPLFHRRCTMPLAEDLEPIANQIRALEAEVVIIDSLARASGGELNKTESPNAFSAALDKLKVTSLILAQTSKDSESKKKTIYGNALFTYYARSIFELCRADYSSEGSMNIALFHRWGNLTRRYPEQAFHLSFNGQHTTIEKAPINVEEFVGKMQTPVAVLQALRRGALSAKDLAEQTGIEEGSIRVALTRLKKRGKVQKTLDGQWGLATSEEVLHL